MGVNGPKTVWVGVRGWTMHELECASTLKGLCEATGVSYNTAKTKDGAWFTVTVGTGLEEKAWTFYQLKVKRVEGRGKKRG